VKHVNTERHRFTVSVLALSFFGVDLKPLVSQCGNKLRDAIATNAVE
jgi:hypothetical protein